MGEWHVRSLLDCGMGERRLRLAVQPLRYGRVWPLGALLRVASQPSPSAHDLSRHHGSFPVRHGALRDCPQHAARVRGEEERRRDSMPRTPGTAGASQGSVRILCDVGSLCARAPAAAVGSRRRGGRMSRLDRDGRGTPCNARMACRPAAPGHPHATVRMGTTAALRIAVQVTANPQQTA